LALTAYWGQEVTIQLAQLHLPSSSANWSEPSHSAAHAATVVLDDDSAEEGDGCRMASSASRASCDERTPKQLTSASAPALAGALAREAQRMTRTCWNHTTSAPPNELEPYDAGYPPSSVSSWVIAPGASSSPHTTL
jgi:hypothetical protein